MTSRSRQPSDAHGRFPSSTVALASTSPGDTRATPFIAGPASDNEVQEGLLAETGPRSTPLNPATPHPPPTLLPRHPPPSLTPNRPPRRYAPPLEPPPVAILQLAYVPPPVIPPAPAGIDPVWWSNSHALILSLLLALRALQPAPAPAAAVPLPEKAPTIFSGDDNSKLRDFLFECNLKFNMEPRTYPTEKSRVLYAIQHLDGMAKRHFHRYIKLGSTDPKVNQWAPFVRELEAVFGDPNRIGRALEKVLNLKMQETSRVNRYTIEFMEAADELGWPDTVLHQLYYRGLPNRIKDLWVLSDPPPNFDDLVRESRRADNRYWTRVEERKRESGLPRRTYTKGCQQRH
jgi:hypothetical protein